LKPPVPGSIPGTGFPEMQGFYLGSHRQVNVRSAHSESSCLGSIASLVTGRCCESVECGERVTEWISAGQQSNVRLCRGAFNQSASTLKSGYTGLTLNVGNA